jgi:hypothetical protein
VQVEVFMRGMIKQIQTGGRRSFFGKKMAASGRDKYTLEDMLSFQREPIPTSLLRMNSDSMNRAVKLFQVLVLYYINDKLAPASRAGSVSNFS